IQYVDRAELPGLLRLLRQKLSPTGRMIVADVIPPDARLFDDIHALLSTAAANGFFLAALGGLATTLVSDYRRLRQRLGLATYTEDEIGDVLHGAGLAITPHTRNLGFHRARRTYIARPTGS